MTRPPFDWRGLKVCLMGVGVAFSGFGLGVLGLRAATVPMALTGFALVFAGVVMHWRAGIDEYRARRDER